MLDLIVSIIIPLVFLLPALFLISHFVVLMSLVIYQWIVSNSEIFIILNFILLIINLNYFIYSRNR